jgi:hypothetical protein
MHTSNGKEQPEMEDYVAERDPVKEEGAGIRRWKLKLC